MVCILCRANNSNAHKVCDRRRDQRRRRRRQRQQNIFFFIIHVRESNLAYGNLNYKCIMRMPFSHHFTVTAIVRTQRMQLHHCTCAVASRAFLLHYNALLAHGFFGTRTSFLLLLPIRRTPPSLAHSPSISTPVATSICGRECTRHRAEPCELFYELPNETNNDTR